MVTIFRTMQFVTTKNNQIKNLSNGLEKIEDIGTVKAHYEVYRG